MANEPRQGGEMSDKPNDAVKEAKGIINAEAIAALERVKGEMHAAHNHGGHDDAAVRAGYCAAHEERIGIINRELAALRGGEGK